jgi:fluoride ion exporter CrcB/FEX
VKLVLWSYLFVAAGGALGAVARFALNVVLQRDVEFPWGTLTANLLGGFACFYIGIVCVRMLMQTHSS